jgi:hypothetical protein
MRPGGRFLIFYFSVFGALSAIALIPGGALVVLLLTAGVVPLGGLPGFLVIASPTILLYSAALVPLWLAWTSRHRRIWLLTVAACVPVVLATGPGWLSRKEARQFGMRMAADDMSRPVAAKPRTIELIGDGMSGMFVYGQMVGDQAGYGASCNEACRRLLFNGEVDWVRMTRIPDIYANGRGGMTRSVTYHIEHRDSCPQFYPAGTTIEKAVRDRLIAGDCVITEVGGDAAPEATVRFTARYSTQHYPSKPPDQGPRRATVETVKDLRIESRQDGQFTPVVQRTETVTHTLALPFYIGSQMAVQGVYNIGAAGQEQTVINPIDVAQAMRDTFGYQIAEIVPLPPEDARRIAERVLALPPDANPVLSTQQQDALNDALAAIAKQPALSDADVDFVRRVIADDRVTEAKLGVVLRTMFRKFTAPLEPLIPVVLDRISGPVPQSVEHYQSSLGWSLTNYSADSLRPYRDKMVAIVEARLDWPSGGLLTRLAELGSDEGVNLVIQRLDSKQSQLAAVAACRASAEAWPVLEPAVLAHLTPPRQGNSLQDDEWPLLLALVRFGNKPLAVGIIEKRVLLDKTGTLRRLAKFEQGFDPAHCGYFI